MQLVLTDRLVQRQHTVSNGTHCSPNNGLLSFQAADWWRGSIALEIGNILERGSGDRRQPSEGLGNVWKR